MAREELKWQNIDADDLPDQVKKSFDAETHEGNEAYRDEPDISVCIVCIPKHGTRA
jgi:hypothetical protein